MDGGICTQTWEIHYISIELFGNVEAVGRIGIIGKDMVSLRETNLYSRLCRRPLAPNHCENVFSLPVYIPHK